jgi:hypothetical protein
MPKIDKLSLTTFLDFATKAGTPKMTVVKNFKGRDKYDPATDFYKAIREAIIDMHENGRDKKSLDGLAAGLKDPKKLTAYPELIKGHKKFLGKKTLPWFKPPTGTWTSGDLEVSVNPELGLEIYGAQHVVKLYFKEPKLTKNRVEIISQLMYETMNHPSTARTFSVLDVRNARLHSPGVPSMATSVLLHAEASCFCAMYARM